MKNFDLFDLLVDQRLEVKQLHRTIFPILEIKSENLLICNGIDEVPSVSLITTSVTLLVVLEEIFGGEFVSLLSFYFKKNYVGIHDPIEIAKRLSTKLKCQCLTSDDQINPYTMLRIDREGHVQQVTLCVTSLQEDKYVVDSVIQNKI